MLYQLSYASLKTAENRPSGPKSEPQTNGHTCSRRVLGTEIKISTAAGVGQTRDAAEERPAKNAKLCRRIFAENVKRCDRKQHTLKVAEAATGRFSGHLFRLLTDSRNFFDLQ